jgi:hypothetical protein
MHPSTAQRVLKKMRAVGVVEEDGGTWRIRDFSAEDLARIAMEYGTQHKDREQQDLYQRERRARRRLLERAASPQSSFLSARPAAAPLPASHRCDNQHHTTVTRKRSLRP